MKSLLRKTFAGFVLSMLTIILSGQTPSSILVNLKDKTAFKEIPVKDGIVKAGALKGEMQIVFPESDDYLNYSIQFNDDKDGNKFILSFDCKDKTCIQIRPGDIMGNRLKLTFENNKLSAIGSRMLKPMSISKTDSPYIKIISSEKKSDDMYSPLLAPDGKIKDLAADASIVAATKYFCGTLICKSCDIKDSCSRSHFACKNTNDFYSMIYTEPHTFYKSISGQKSSAKYWVIHDLRDGRKPVTTYLKNKGRGGNDDWVIRKSLTPVVGKQMVVTVIGSADSTYIIDTALVQNFVDKGPEIASVIDGVKPGGSTKETSPPASATPTTASLPPIPSGISNPGPRALFDVQKALEISGKKYNYSSGTSTLLSLKMMGEIQDSTAFDFGLTDANIKSLSADNKSSPVLEEIIGEYITALKRIDTLQKQNKNLASQVINLNSLVTKLNRSITTLNARLAKAAKEINLLKDSLGVATKELEKQVGINDAYPVTKNLKEKLVALERDLEIFNGQYDDISFKKEEYKADLLCMQLKIKEVLQIPVSGNSKDLAQSLINLTGGIIKDSGYFKEFHNLIKSIESQYAGAVSKKEASRLYSTSKKVANTDEIEVRLKTSNIKEPFYTETYSTSWGLKIDFSTGVFLTGLTSPSYNLAQHRFQYLPKVIGSSGQDSISYAGRDTVGNLIQANQSKISYSAGFLVHAYPRTGLPVNAGLATGLTINNSNTSPLQLMLGGSLMFNAGKSRISIVGGVVWGQVKAISSVATPYLWDGTKDNTRYSSQYNLPAFYSGSSDIPTFDTWKHSWFFGITYNFASLNAGK